MEHRCGARCPVRYPVLIACEAKRSPVHGLTRNLAPGGAFIAELSRPLQPHQPVELVLRTPRSAVVEWRWPAVVLRSGPEGAALMFEHLHFGEFAQLLAALRVAELSWRWGPVRPLPQDAPAAARLPASHGYAAALSGDGRQARQ